MKKYIKYFTGGLITAVLGVFAISLLGPTTQTQAYTKCTPHDGRGTPNGSSYYVEDGTSCHTGHLSEYHEGEPIPDGSNTNSPAENAEHLNETLKENSSGGSGDDDPCVDAGGVLGWAVCPIVEMTTNFVDDFMGLIESSLEWSIGDELLDIWTGFLPIANIAFAIVFLIVIYSTATGVGLNNYSVKKIMPRLIIVAIAVNVSYYICIALADLSNIVGANIGSLLESTQTNSTQWSAADTITGIFGIIGTLAAAFFALMSAGTLALAILVIFLAVTARYIVLFLLIIISPVAIVAALLPQTEKWFKKWLNTYVQMLVVYPIFMIAWQAVRWIQDEKIILYMGSTGAAPAPTLIGYIITMFLPIIPLFVIMPALKFGGGLMSKMTGAIQKGAQSSPLGNVAKGVDREIKGFTSNIGNKKEMNNLDNADNVEDAHDKNKQAFLDKHGLTEDDLKKEVDKGSSIGKEWSDIKDNYEQALKEAKELDNTLGVENEENKAYNKSAWRRFKSIAGTGGQISSGETYRRWEQNQKDRYGKDEERRLQQSREDKFRKTGKSNIETAAMRAQNATDSYNNLVLQEKLSEERRDLAGIEDDKTGAIREGVLYGHQTRSNALKQESEALNKEIGSDADRQALGRASLQDRSRMADRTSEIFKNRQNTFVANANDADLQASISLREKPLEDLDNAKERFIKTMDEEKNKNKNYKEATEEIEIANAGKASIEANIDKNRNGANELNTEIAEMKKSLGNAKGNDKINLKGDIKDKEKELENVKDNIQKDQQKLKDTELAIEGSKNKQKEALEEINKTESVVKAQGKVDSANRELAETEVALKDDAAFQFVNSAKQASNAKSSYEASVSRASRGLTSEVNAQRIGEIKERNDAKLEADKVQRLAEDESIQSINRETRATKERTVNINRAVNVDYADKIKENPTLATYAGGGGISNTDGILRQSDDLAKMQSMGAADKIADSDWAERSANIKSYLNNNPDSARWDDLNKNGGLIKRAIAEKNTAVLNAVNEYEKGKGQIGKMQEVIDQISESPSYQNDAGMQQFVVNQNISLGEDSFVDQNYAKYVGALGDMGKGREVMSRKDWLTINSSGEVPVEVARKYYDIDESKVKNGKVKVTAAFVPLTDIKSSKVAKYDKDSMEQLAAASPENFIEMAEKYGIQNINGSGSKKQMAMFKEILTKLPNEGDGRKTMDKILLTANARADINPSSKKAIIEFMTGKPTDAKGNRIRSKDENGYETDVNMGSADAASLEHIRNILIEKYNNPNLRGEMTEKDIKDLLGYAINPDNNDERSRQIAADKFISERVSTATNSNSANNNRKYEEMHNENLGDV